MPAYRNALPQLGPRLFLTDGGIETTLIFEEGLALPEFAAFPLLDSPAGRAALGKYYRTYARIAGRHGAGLVLESPTWRASPDWGARLGYTPQALDDVNRRAIALLEGIRSEFETPSVPIVISGCIGPRGDGYVADRAMDERQARDYHRRQVEVFAGTNADMLCAMTLNYVEEALGIARAAQAAAMPLAISFTIETDGKLPTGQPLKAALEQVDQATAGYPSYYMINCAHPTHIEAALCDSGAWTARIRAVRANASSKSHAELNEATGLDAGDPVQLGRQYAHLLARLPRLNVLGGCCGTDHRHLEQIASACAPLFGTEPEEHRV